MDREIITLTEVRQRQLPYDIAYTWNLKKKDINEFIYKTKIDPQTENKHMVTKWEKKEG